MDTHIVGCLDQQAWTDELDLASGYSVEMIRLKFGKFRVKKSSKIIGIFQYLTNLGKSFFPKVSKFDINLRINLFVALLLSHQVLFTHLSPENNRDFRAIQVNSKTVNVASTHSIFLLRLKGGQSLFTWFYSIQVLMLKYDTLNSS